MYTCFLAFTLLVAPILVQAAPPRALSTLAPTDVLWVGHPVVATFSVLPDAIPVRSVISSLELGLRGDRALIWRGTPPAPGPGQAPAPWLGALVVGDLWAGASPVWSPTAPPSQELISVDVELGAREDGRVVWRSLTEVRVTKPSCVGFLIIGKPYSGPPPPYLHGRQPGQLWPLTSYLLCLVPDGTVTWDLSLVEP